MQADRVQFIQNMSDEGFWGGTELTGSTPKLWVTNAFLLADEKTQNETLSVVYAYWMGEMDMFGGHGFYWDSIVLKIDNATPTGRRVARYDPINGIKRD